MKNSDLWKQHEDYTSATSSNCRQLAFGAAAISWLFKDAANSNHIFPDLILYAICFLVLFFVADLFQYLTAALLLRFWIGAQEKSKFEEYGTLDVDYDKPLWLDWPAFYLWLIKIVFLCIAYACIGYYLLQNIGWL